MQNAMFILAAALFLVMQGATLATKYAARIAAGFHLSKYTVGFLVVAVISILPETFVALNAAERGIPAFGLGTLFGSNVADLTLVFAGIVLLVKRGIRIEPTILKNGLIYPLLLIFSLTLGWDGYYSRLEGVALMIAGGVFYYSVLKDGADGKAVRIAGNSTPLKNFFFLLIGLAFLLIGSHFTVLSASDIAAAFGVSPIFIGMLIVGLGTTMPEFFFALEAVKKRNDSLAVGDVLGTVLADATVVVGLLALVQPFAFPKNIIYITGFFMVLASVLLFVFMRSKRTLSKKEAFLLFLFWLLFVLTEFFANL